ncbi:MAG: phage tail sheath protein [Firmicutes bacterium]|nr:phage tail sheath protein [Bacillota bacterium]
MYKHGAFADIMATKDFISPSGVGTLPVYFGTAPVNQLADSSDTVKKPILIQSFNDAKKKIGYSDSWDKYTLCEAIYAHFKNDIQPIGPIVVINGIDPSTHKTTGETDTITMTNGVGYLDDEDAILSSIKIADKTLGTDYLASFTDDGIKVTITDLNGSLGESVSITYDKINLTNITASTIEELTSSVNMVYQTFNMIPTILASPGWSSDKNVDIALKVASDKINGHFFAFVNSDIDSSTTITIEQAKIKKTTDDYTSNIEAPCWPMGKKGDKKFHLSTLATVTMQMVDFQNGNIPSETPSNKPIDISSLCLADGKEIEYDQIGANDLNSKGIRTASFWGGRWVLWGPHTGEYEYAKDIDPKNIFDSSVRMLHYIANVFQLKYGILIDGPFSRAMKDTILNDMQEWLDNLIAQGKLLSGTIVFNELSNPTSDIVEGDFVFDISSTTTPPGKSITAKITYTSSGLDVLFGGDGQ